MKMPKIKTATEFRETLFESIDQAAKGQDLLISKNGSTNVQVFLNSEPYNEYTVK